MESWKKGREELLDEYTRVCNKIEKNIAAELDNENFTTVARDELRYLREKSNRADELAEENKRLADELKGHNETYLRVEALEKENKRLQQKAHIGTLGGPQTPRSSEPPLSGESTTTARGEKYNALVQKHNDLFKRYRDMSDTKKIVEAALTKEKQKVKDWTASGAQKDEKIQKQRETIRRLKAKLDGLEGTPIPDSSEPTSVTSTKFTTAPVEIPVSPLRPVPTPIQVPVSTSEKIPAERIAPKDPQHRSVEEALGQLEEDGNADESPDLPNLLREGRFSVDEPQFEFLEVDHPSSTQEDPDSPNRATTETDAAKPQAPVGHPPSDDIPIVISSRSVKKRKARNDTVEPTPVSKVKLEKLDSSPIGLARLHYLNPNESLDLDDIGEKVDTPKKRRQVALARQASRISQSTNSPLRDSQIQGTSHTPVGGENDEMQDTPSRRTGISRTGSALRPLSTNRQILPRTSDDRPAKKRRIASDKAVEDLVEDGQDVSIQDKTPKRRVVDTTERLDGLLSKPSPEKRVLSPVQRMQINTPKPINEHTRSKASATSGLAREVRNPNGYDSDGASSIKSRKSRECTENARPSSKGTPRTSVEPSRPSSKGSLIGSAQSAKQSPGLRGNQSDIFSRLERLLPPKTPNAVPQPASRDSRALAGPSRPTSAKGQPRKSAEFKTSPAKRTPRSRTDAMEPIWNDNPDNEPLRTRAVGTLGLDDFKVNPEYNQGYNYAFKDVVRNQEQRRCLPGCTRPECCGDQIRKLVELLEDNGRPRTMSQDERDEELLEEFMGDNAYKIRNMSKAERDEMLLQAKTRDYANKHGRHRHAYERMRSPPGFWDTDFPTTQEEMANREKANEYVRNQVAERYAHAMRPGGAYIFRDE
ncbi:hypothetical protein LSUE1_G003873 [Lachnellula suecica]|uniref:DNA endonuclease activator Ctp1 C-terminal domain-containing protein n=1 Tax=Lachnellula suecica TaxID=602035 RepID=A0A8T9C9W7_9HELO|nr:hypothetical protein LSUE1_G003873 [Lachnellula suecica]